MTTTFWPISKLDVYDTKFRLEVQLCERMFLKGEHSQAAEVEKNESHYFYFFM